MTRGTFAIITDKGILTSLEFNGDMYIEDHGKAAIDELKPVKDLKDFHEMIERFNSKYFKYTDDVTRIYPMEDKNALDMSENYYENWFSDYIYMKNLTNEPVKWIDANKETRTINPYSIVVINFGKYTGVTDENVNIYLKNLSQQGKKNALFLFKNDLKSSDIESTYRSYKEIGIKYVSQNYTITKNKDCSDFQCNPSKHLADYIDFNKIGIDIVQNNIEEWSLLPNRTIIHIKRKESENE